MEQNNIWKKIGIAIGGFLTALISFIIYGTTRRSIRDNRDRVNDVRDDLRKAEDTNKSARDTVEDIRSTVSDIEQTNTECSDIIANIRKRGPKK